MADFIQKAAIKSAVRNLAAPIADLSTFTTLIQEVIDTNPFECTSYTVNGASVNGITRTREQFSGVVIYENSEAKTVGQITIRAPNASAFSSNVATILATAALGTAMGGTPSHDSSDDSFSATLKCHDANGEYYNVAFKRNSITISSYEADSIRANLESWADTIGILA